MMTFMDCWVGFIVGSVGDLLCVDRVESEVVLDIALGVNGMGISHNPSPLVLLWPCMTRLFFL